MGYRTRIQLCPADKIAVITLANADDGDPLKYNDKAFQWVAPAIVKATKPLLPATKPDPKWQTFIGKYRNAWEDLQILNLNGELMMIDPSLPDPTLTMNKLIPVTENTFRLEAAADFADNVGELVIFELDNEGQVSRIKIGQNYAYPQLEW
jgi:hypothetical protein